MFEASLSYVSEKVRATVHTLATHPGALHARLLDAYRSQGYRAHPPSGDVPPDIAQRLVRVHDALTAGPDEGDGLIAGAVAALNDDEVRELAEELWSLNYEIEIAIELRRTEGVAHR